MILTRAVWLAAAAVLVAGPASACMGDKVLFEDRFDQPNPGWGKYLKNRVVIGGGAMKVTPEPKRRQFVQYRGDLYGDADVCVDITVPALRSEGAAGLLFGYEDYVGFNFFWVNAPGGLAGIDRWSDTASKWLHPVNSRKVAGLDVSGGAKVALRLTLNGTRAISYINNKEFVQFKVSPTELGGFIGLEAEAGETSGTWIFNNFKITNLPR